MSLFETGIRNGNKFIFGLVLIVVLYLTKDFDDYGL